MKFHPEKSLFDLSIVRWTFLITVIFATSTTAIILWNSNLYFKPDYDGLNKSIEIFKVPLGMLAVGLSLIGICGANHRSEQTKRQIERTGTQIALTQSQNNFANYYKHIEEFDKYCAKISSEKVSVHSTREAHRKLFPNSRGGEYEVSNDASTILDDSISSFLIEIFNFQDSAEFPPALKRALQLRQDLLKNFSVQQSVGNTSSEFKIDNVNYKIFDTSYANFISAYVELFTFIDKVLSFDVNHKPPANMLFLKNVDVAGYRGRRINPYKPEPLEFAEIFGHDAFSFVIKTQA
jgi:hypothetical protein